MPYDKVCQYVECGKPFSTPFRLQQYCSISCANSGRALITPEATKAYFFEHVDRPKKGKKQCWVWTGSLNDAGYGMAFVRKESIRAHRLAYELFVGSIPEGLDILHGPTCTTRACVNPYHLRPGTNTENVEDRMMFGDERRGSDHHNARLTERQVEKILQQFHNEGWTQGALAEEYGCSATTIYDIIARVSWKHVFPGKYPAPTKDGRAKLTPLEVQQIRQLRFDFNMTFDAIAERFHMSNGHIQAICAGQVWGETPAMLADYQAEATKEVQRTHITPEHVRTIRRLFGEGMSAPKIAKQFGITRQQISNIVHHRSYAEVDPHIPPPPQGRRTLLTEDDVRTIRRMHREQALSYARLADDFHVSKPTIVAVCTRRLYAHVE